ncbi:hypothetical protein R1flu_016734 [Riccia fluitans]|uniref:Uncharacterized protein n=1 Tax=Riccia fluitans TaxID=41844 RepID=A0ABD1YN81_9MARC
MCSYHDYTTISRWNSDVKCLFARIILGMGDLAGRAAVGHGDDGGRARRPPSRRLAGRAGGRAVALRPVAATGRAGGCCP